MWHKFVACGVYSCRSLWYSKIINALSHLNRNLYSISAVINRTLWNISWGRQTDWCCDRSRYCQKSLTTLNHKFLACDVHPYCARIGQEGNMVCEEYAKLAWIVDPFHIKGHKVNQWTFLFWLKNARTLFMYIILIGTEMWSIPHRLSVSSWSTKISTFN